MEHDNLYKIRHSLAHLLAMAALDKYPSAKLTIGPAIDSGFYYDIDFGSDKVGEDELKDLQKRMKKLAGQSLPFLQVEMSETEAREYFKDNEYKLELIDSIVADGGELTFYKTGNDFIDLCAGGHVENTSEIPTDAFRLEKIAGAYWRGDENNTMLTRIYGVAFENKEALDEHDDMMREAAKRDHRKLGKELNLFTFSDLVGPGLPLYTPNGQLMRENIKDLLWELSKAEGYQKVEIPHITKIDLYETSGHAAKFKDEFFYVHGAQSNDDFVMKPMNCPHHTQIFASCPRTYRDLPIRMAEVTHMYRDEKPGQLMGLSRVRSIAIDDAHVFCRMDQIKQESLTIADIIKKFYTKFGLWNKGETFWVSLSVRDPQTPDEYLGTNEGWNTAEALLQEVSDDLKLDAKRMEGEAAFYGPKLDFMFTDALGRERQLATIQIDFVMPERFGLEFINQRGEKECPVMIHRAVAGSLERFMAIMIEHFAGAFPFWLAPVQVSVIPVNAEVHGDKAQEVADTLRTAGFRVQHDADTKDGMGKQVREAKKQKYPYWIIIGDADIEADKVTLESRDTGDNEQLSIEEVIAKFTEENQ
jgi:threonyl-tRNA synthetase